MVTEIERKFLVKGNFLPHSQRQTHIVQAYLSSAQERTVRVRIKGDKAYLTIKGASNSQGTSRFEWEKEITTDDAHELLALCEPGIIDKIRHEIKVGIHTFEVDVFAGENEGLVLAEVELSNENEYFERPEWLGIEVTGDNRYYNSKLMKNPFSKWK